jgi:hypothetical protein
VDIEAETNAVNVSQAKLQHTRMQPSTYASDAHLWTQVPHSILRANLPLSLVGEVMPVSVACWRGSRQATSLPRETRSNGVRKSRERLARRVDAMKQVSTSYRAGNQNCQVGWRQEKLEAAAELSIPGA